MMLVLGCAAAAVAGVGLVTVAAFGPRPPLAVEVARLLHPAPAPPPARGLDSLAQTIWARLDPAGGRFPGLMADLAVMDRSPESLVRQAVATAGLFAATAAVCTASLGLGGVRVPAAVGAWLAVLAGLAGAVAPYPSVRADAGRRRAEMRDALAVVCDLTAVRVAAGEDLEAALGEAIEVGGGWAFQALNRAAAAASVTRHGAWVTLGALGERLRVDELVSLAQHLELAGTEGAKIRDALRAQAKALREDAAAEVKATAGSVTERMSVPMVALLAGFIVIIGYPAVTRL